MVLVGEFLGGAALGAAFGLLFDVVKEAIDKSTTFNSLLKNIKSTLDFLKPVIEKIAEQNMELGLPEEEIRYLTQQMEEGVELVRRSSKVCKWNCMKYHYTDQLVELDGSLRRLLDVLKVQGVRDVKETLVLVRKNGDQLIESARDGKETLYLVRKNGDQLTESARDGKETLDLTRKINMLVKRIERLVILCPHKGKSRNQTRNRVSSANKRGGRSRFSEAASSRINESHTEGQVLETSNSRFFSFKELKTACRNFRPEGLLGEGSFGKVFKGWVDEKTLVPSNVGTGMIIAVKKWKPESFQGLEEWKAEVDFLGTLSHPNLVKLLGNCSADNELLLVYEFMQKGSLEVHLFKRTRDIEAVLSWDNRLKIAIGVARALTFLHSLPKQIIHRDVKSSNILLDENYNAKLSGFGLAILGPTDGESYIETKVIGTYGYAAPEYVSTGNLYVKSDVYSFGVVLLEILTGLGAIDTNRSFPKQNLVDWAKPLLSHKRNLKTFMDAKINGQYSSKEALQTAKVTLKCLASDPKGRPSMKEVVDALEQIQAIKEYSKQTELTPTTKSTPSSQS
ncbi:putative transferase, protein kinase RLK-Pelle-RLCK-VIIa-2 family [Rosa chinensis]|uniref:non-specific serine/threonine protein kinase n=1 Tax=Rosa chinensis TaxID=74649 RepID=A0A2P6RMS4_ROSCH|nr:probable serine/threonine-protein kinase PBL11 [Rosa chinensis]PRQ47736.1 putative transferase, protein kinase RLK-Pelle-RLCK-VIIa-2 family [Rosa chinensis]